MSLPVMFKKPSQVVMAHSDGDDFTLLDRKVFNVLLANAYKKLQSAPSQKVHQIKMDELAAAVLEPHEDLRRIKQSLKRLWEVLITIQYTAEDGLDYELRCHYLSYAMSEIEGSTLTYAFDEMLLQFLSYTQVYALIDLRVVTAVKSGYASKLYERMAMSYRLLNPEWRIDVESLRAWLELGNKYADRFDHFKSKVIERAIEDVNEQAPFSVSVKYIREGRGGKVKEVVFRATPKSTQDFQLLGAGRSRPMAPGRADGTVDMFEERTPEEMSVPPELMSHTIAEARRILGNRGEVMDYRDKWFEKFGAKCFRGPDELFLSWLKMHVGQVDEETLKGVDVDAIMGKLMTGGIE
jgi:Protein involved in initiation of plasmid replication